MDDFKKHLAEQVLSEEKIVTYRALSRAHKVNVNIAKQMLYEFHSTQNQKHPGTVHATYMIFGVKRASPANGHSNADGDVEMTSSPPVAPTEVEEVPVATLSLVSEENLIGVPLFRCLDGFNISYTDEMLCEDVLSQYENVTSIHIYSLGPHAVKDIQLLADVSRPILDVPAIDETVNPPKVLGAVRNPHVRRRDRRAPASQPAPVSKKPGVKPVPAKPATVKPTAVQEVKEERNPDKKPSSKESTPTPSGQTGAKKEKATSKRGAPGGIMQSFAKAATMPKKAAKSKPETPADDSDMQALSDDGEDDSTALEEPVQENAAARKSRKDRQEALKRMMEESSEDEEPEKEDTPMEEAVEEPPAPVPEEKEPEPAEVISSAGGGRRRGKRRVMKKKTVMDDQGYLVTRQEAGWESFSEDEPAPPPKTKTENASQPAKLKKTAPKGQGNIMSFFGKK